MKKFYFKVILPTILSIFLFALTIFFVIIPRVRVNIMNGKREMIRELTNTAISILSEYEAAEREGNLERKDAQTMAASTIHYLRYGEENKDYFWITDLVPVMIVHPYRPDLNGKNLSTFEDAHGKRLFVEFVDTVRQDGSGYVDYMWQWLDDSLQIVPKLSYVKLFEPWGWVIGTGIYIEDVKKEIASLTKSMIWISTGISILIALMLFYILKQSYNIERKRINAENELHESRERYRALVEAATDGLIMLIDGKISFFNNVITKITGFENHEILHKSFYDIISPNNSKETLGMFMINSVKDGRYEVNLNKKGGGSVDVIITISTAVFYSQPVKVIIVRDISAERNVNYSNLEIQKLITTLHLGFFKIRLDSKGYFTYVSEAALKILGYDNFEDLNGVPVLNLITDPLERKELRKELAEKGFIRNKVLKISKKSGEPAVIHFSLVVNTNEQPDNTVFDGIIEDITQQETERIIREEIIAEVKAWELIMQQTVADNMSTITALEAEASLSEAILTLQKRKTDHLLLTRSENKYLGIITNTDIQKRILALDLKLDNPAYMIMSSPIIYVHGNTSVHEAMNICEENNINHLAVRNATDNICGIFKTSDISKKLSSSMSFYMTGISRADTVEELSNSYHKLKTITKSFIRNDVSVKYITGFVSSFSDAVTRRIIEISIRECGVPPSEFSFISMGSEGRKEETLFTDQDNAIIYEDVSSEKETETRDYFMKLGKSICTRLNAAGYSFCKGNIMAMNPQWCQPLASWKKYFFNWISTPEPQNLLDAIIFFDFRHIFGNRELTVKLRETIIRDIKANPLFLYHVAYNIFNIKILQLHSGIILSDRASDTIDLKTAIAPIVMIARAYSLKHGIWYSNTIDRLKALKDLNVLSGTAVDDLSFIYNFLMKLRLRNQAEQDSDGTPLSNLVHVQKLNGPEIHMLKKILSLTADYQNKIKTDFRLSI